MSLSYRNVYGYQSKIHPDLLFQSREAAEHYDIKAAGDYFGNEVIDEIRKGLDEADCLNARLFKFVHELHEDAATQKFIKNYQPQSSAPQLTEESNV